KREERTTEGGLDVTSGVGALPEVVAMLQGDGIPVSLFIVPLLADVRAAAASGARRIELHTGGYCEARGDRVGPELDRLAGAAEEGVALGLHVAAGHGLDYPNVAAVAAISGIEELNIGHAIVSRAVLVGLERAVRDMLALIIAPA